MENKIVLMLILQLVLIALNAVFACAEIAVISMNDTKLMKMAADKDRRAIRLVKLTSQPARFLATIQVAITLSGFLGSAFAAENFSGVLVNWLLALGVPLSAQLLDTIAVVLITLILSYFTLVFGELVPKQIAMRKAEPLALGMSGLISFIAKVFAPLVSFLSFSTNSVLRLVGIDPNAQDDNVSEEEIRMMVDVGSEKGSIDHEEREFIQNVFEFDDLAAGEILTHRTEVIMLDTEDDMDSWKELIYSSRHTLYPVCEGSADRIIGILNAKDYFRLEDKSRENIMAKAVTAAYFVPDSIRADDLFRNMRKGRIQLAVVLDEYGGMTGIVTINDLVEQLVGELADEDEAEEVLIEAIDSLSWRIHGGAYLEDVSRALGVSLCSDEYDTFNGLVVHALQSIPEDGADIRLELSGLIVEDIHIRDRQVESATVRKL